MAKMAYEQWMAKVNLELIKLCGMDSEWLPDYCYGDCYKAGESPRECAEEAIEYFKDY